MKNPSLRPRQLSYLGCSLSRGISVAFININAGIFAHGDEPLARWKEKPSFSCSTVTPQAIFEERLNLFDTVTHELAHAIRALNGTRLTRFSSFEAMREEENVARVFAGLMQAKYFQTAGVLSQRENVFLHKWENPTDPKMNIAKYEAVGPIQAAILITANNREYMDKATPAQLLDLAEKLVASHDLTLGMSDSQRADYYKFLQGASKTPEAIASRLALPQYDETGPAAKFNAITIQAALPKKPGQSQDTLPPATTDTSIPHTQAMRRIDEAQAYNLVIGDGLTAARERLNPLLPPAMRAAQLADANRYDEVAIIAAAKAREQFGEDYRHRDCPSSGDVMANVLLVEKLRSNPDYGMDKLKPAKSKAPKPEQ
jgi:hypothetical protein